jgi:flagellar hook-basal body complex protein FliE
MTNVAGLVSAVQQMGVGGAAATQAAPAGGVPFGSLLSSMVKESGDLDAKAQQATMGLMNGSGVEVHDVMIATQKASMAFELGLQMRNKAVAAYQQMMNMQF